MEKLQVVQNLYYEDKDLGAGLELGQHRTRARQGPHRRSEKGNFK